MTNNLLTSIADISTALDDMNLTKAANKIDNVLALSVRLAKARATLFSSIKTASKADEAKLASNAIKVIKGYVDCAERLAIVAEKEVNPVDHELALVMADKAEEFLKLAQTDYKGWGNAIGRGVGGFLGGAAGVAGGAVLGPAGAIGGGIAGAGLGQSVGGWLGRGVGNAVGAIQRLRGVDPQHNFEQMNALQQQINQTIQQAVQTNPAFKGDPATISVATNQLIVMLEPLRAKGEAMAKKQNNGVGQTLFAKPQFRAQTITLVKNLALQKNTRIQNKQQTQQQALRFQQSMQRGQLRAKNPKQQPNAPVSQAVKLQLQSALANPKLSLKDLTNMINGLLAATP